MVAFSGLLLYLLFTRALSSRIEVTVLGVYGIS
jgi:hypothetical protein